MKPPFGYRLAADGGLERDEREQEVVAILRRLLAEGIPLCEVLARLNRDNDDKV